MTDQLWLAIRDIWLRRERIYQETIDAQQQTIAALQARIKDAAHA